MKARHRSVEFVKFLDTIDQQVPRYLAVHVVLDNLVGCSVIRASLCTSPRRTPPGSIRSNDGFRA
jgi:hypothetical protein